MTTTTRNEAAERLRKAAYQKAKAYDTSRIVDAETLADALAEYCADLVVAERRATVEEIRQAYLAYNVPVSSEEFYRGIDAASGAIFVALEEAAR